VDFPARRQATPAEPLPLNPSHPCLNPKSPRFPEAFPGKSIVDSTACLAQSGSFGRWSKRASSIQPVKVSQGLRQ
jgi:hypothetical protein